MAIDPSLSANANSSQQSAPAVDSAPARLGYRPVAQLSPKPQSSSPHTALNPIPSSETVSAMSRGGMCLVFHPPAFAGYVRGAPNIVPIPRSVGSTPLGSSSPIPIPSSIQLSSTAAREPVGAKKETSTPVKPGSAPHSFFSRGTQTE